ncbi:MAG: metalloregulator ArsR/SmtB family transcription factor [Akkermansia sp.]
MLCDKNALHCENARLLHGKTLSTEKADSLALIFKALSEPVRLRILSCLMRGELCVHDMALLLAMSQPAISNQLRQLRLHRLVKFRKDGNRVFYSLNDEHVEALYHIGLEHSEHL